ncbi:hypothetical protein UB37_07080 [Photobacterium iliopiscarium]|uniref:DUF4062 domain-containing protein n=1 Tax=Photobacterium iliopiscarium TaxID=56192 RepID=A0ABX5GVN3_9GAMM|nr:DUF4062 domain-containing protein [Photobacterium iliopiscarium]KJG23274.1 hypothetical protein UB37_07080 [Photobacterium iliopiscarium]PSW99097.1 DUF4062 domain-containing protein [Photobacterium iliopiscarium]
MNSIKYQVFISSTYSDLVEERESIIKAILEMYHIPIGMEMFSAEDEDQWEIIRRTIEVSDYYILVLGLRYGSKTSDGISFTQKEYEYALEKKIPVLAFVMDDMVSLSKDKRDDDLTEMNQFRNLVLKNSKMAQFWRSKEELIKNVSISLMKQIMQKPAVGWVRGDKLGAEEILTEELTSLSKENRQLREKISELESKISPKSPMIEVLIESPKVDEKFNEFDLLVLPQKIDLNSVEKHLHEFVSKEDIEKYNNKIPTQSDIEQYNSGREKKYKLDNYSTPLLINVSNSGSIKGNNIFIDITFPEGILVYRKGDNFSGPVNPLPINPIKRAREKYEKKQEDALRKNHPLFSLYDRIGLNERTISAISGVPGYQAHIGTIRPINPNFWTDLNGSKLLIKLNSLLHTRRKVFDDEYMVVPLTTGIHKIEVEIICEEYEKLDTKIIEIIV